MFPDLPVAHELTSTRRWVIGLSSGSTLDGVDAVLLEAEGVGTEAHLHLLHAAHQPYPPDLQNLIRHVGTSTKVNIQHTSVLHSLLGEAFSAAAVQVVNQIGFGLRNVQCIGCSGHTIYHNPEHRFPSTLGLGMAAVIAERTGITTVSDFQSRDLVVGGKGSALTSLVDYLLHRHPNEHRVLINLGGVSSIVALPAGCSPRQLQGFQAGPCSGFLDRLISRMTRGKEKFDAGGKQAVQGRCIEPLLRQWASRPILQQPPPKTLQEHHFGDVTIDETMELSRANNWTPRDVLCTATHLVASCIGASLQRFVPFKPDRIILSGGGVRNGLLRKLLEQQFGDVEMTTISDMGIPEQSRKAIGFGGLAALTLDGVPANLMSVTGAQGARLLGSITPGSATNWAKCLQWMMRQTSHLVPA